MVAVIIAFLLGLAAGGTVMSLAAANSIRDREELIRHLRQTIDDDTIPHE